MCSRFCLLVAKLRISQQWDETIECSSHQCTGVNIRSCSPSSWSCRVQTVSSASCGPPPSWPTTTPTTASPERRHRSPTWRKCRGEISPSPGTRAEIKITPSCCLSCMSWIHLSSVGKWDLTEAEQYLNRLTAIIQTISIGWTRESSMVWEVAA